VNIQLIKARDWALNFNSDLAEAPGAEFRWNGKVGEPNGVVFIDVDGVDPMSHYGKFDMNVIVCMDPMDPMDADASDENQFRQYIAPINDILRALQQCELIAAQLSDLTLNQIDRMLLKELRFTRAI
jgi:hypothetical protein